MQYMVVCGIHEYMQFMADSRPALITLLMGIELQNHPKQYMVYELCTMGYVQITQREVGFGGNFPKWVEKFEYNKE